MMLFWGRNWWVIVFCLMTALVHVHFLKGKTAAVRELSTRLEEMEKEKMTCLARRDDLALRIASQSDPAWIEMILMRDLGVVPEGFFKVHFTK